jgi:hypothetical protein
MTVLTNDVAGKTRKGRKKILKGQRKGRLGRGKCHVQSIPVANLETDKTAGTRARRKVADVQCGKRSVLNVFLKECFNVIPGRVRTGVEKRKGV